MEKVFGGRKRYRFWKRRRQRGRAKEGRQVCALLALASASVCFCGVAVLLVADDGSAGDVDYGGRQPSDIECLHAVVRLRAAQTLRPEFEVPLDRHGRGVVLLGTRGNGRGDAVAAIRRAMWTTSPGLACCGSRPCSNLDKRPQRQALYHSPDWPLEAWTYPVRAYHPFIFATVPTAERQAVVVVRDPVLGLARAWPGNLDGLIQAVTNNSGILAARIDSQARHLVGAIPSVDRCFAYVFHQRLLAFARGHWLPFVAERPEESLVVLATAYRWPHTALAPPRSYAFPSAPHDKPRPSPAQRRALAQAQPFDDKLYVAANNALSAWQAHLGKAFTSALDDLRDLHRAWAKTCISGVNFTARGRAPPPPPKPDVCAWFDPSLGRRPPWATPACTLDPLWSTWCAIATRF